MKALLPILTLTLIAACSPPRKAETPAELPPPATSAMPVAPKVAAQQGSITVADPWIATSPNGAKTAAGYVMIENVGAEGDELIAAVSPRAASVELHDMSNEGGMMSMKHAKTMPVPPNGALELKPGGRHLMFFDFPRPFKAGEEVPMTLTFKKAGAVSVTFIVRDGGAGDMAPMP